MFLLHGAEACPLKTSTRVGKDRPRASFLLRPRVRSLQKRQKCVHGKTQPALESSERMVQQEEVTALFLEAEKQPEG